MGRPEPELHAFRAGNDEWEDQNPSYEYKRAETAMMNDLLQKQSYMSADLAMMHDEYSRNRAACVQSCP
jgi:hypothetical protein